MPERRIFVTVQPRFVRPAMRQHIAHGDRHPYTGNSVRFDTFGLWVAEEHEDGVADVFVDRPTKLQSDLGLA